MLHSYPVRRRMLPDVWGLREAMVTFGAPAEAHAADAASHDHLYKKMFSV